MVNKQLTTKGKMIHYSKFALAGLLTASWAAQAQINLSGGLAYTQNFDTLASSGTPAWADNSTLPGWYASQSIGGPAVATYRASTGSSVAGAIYSFGVAGVNPVTDRALGSIATGTPGNLAYGVRFQNDTAQVITSPVISYTGEQWRNGGNTAIQTLAFSYLISSTPITSSDAADANAWVSFAALDFNTPIVGASVATLDGNDPANRTVFSNILLTGVSLSPGQEIFFRWFDVNDAGNDHALAIDDFSVSFSVVPEPSALSLGGLGLLGLSCGRRSIRHLIRYAGK
jgi:hypothetical protein